MAEFRMPSLGADMDAGTVVEWLVKPGDTVTKGDVVAVVDTAKAAVEVECFDTGVIEELLVPEGQSVPVGTPLAVIVAQGDKPPPPKPPAAPPPARPAARVAPVSPIVRKMAAQAGVDLSAVHGTGRGGALTRRDVARAATNGQATRVAEPSRPAPAPPRAGGPRPVSPYARRLAAELTVDLGQLQGQGSGPITSTEVRAHAAGPQPVTPTARPQRKSAAPDMRSAIAELMTKANQEIPHYHLAATVDMRASLSWLREHNRAVAVSDRLLPAALLLKATALAAAQVPELNGHWVDGGFRPSSTVELGVAVSVRGGGLLVPVLSTAETMPITELMHQLRDRASRARSGRPRSSDLGAPSITVTNLGDLGVELVHGVIHPPQVALVGFGAILDRPWAVDGMLGVRPVVTVTLAADHRATDGAVGGRLLHAIDRLLQRPEELS